MRVVLTIGVLMVATPALAYPTEVDPGELRDKRLAAVRRYRWLENVRVGEEAVDSPEPSLGSSVPPQPAPTSGPIAAYLRAAGFPEDVIPTMVQIALRESGGDPSAVNPSSGACGLFQIFPAQPGCLDPWINSAMAYEKYQAAGLSPWGG